uniref:Uncharacterized protein n=1 Tax=Anopheles atroparvus TaxID=41427 RepID=A0A182JHJ0_ANOAO
MNLPCGDFCLEGAIHIKTGSRAIWRGDAIATEKACGREPVWQSQYANTLQREVSPANRRGLGMWRSFDFTTPVRWPVPMVVVLLLLKPIASGFALHVWMLLLVLMIMMIVILDCIT